MSKPPIAQDAPAPHGEFVRDSQLVYVVSPEREAASDEIDLLEVWNLLWRAKWFIIGLTSVFVIGAVAWALLATEWFRAEVLLAPVTEERGSALMGNLGGLASLAGVNMGGGGRSYEAQAVLQSRDLTRTFIEQRQLLPILFADQWDSTQGAWRIESPADSPNTEDAVKFFSDNVRTVREDSNTLLVTLSVEWTDPVLAAEWANQLVSLVNDRMRGRALIEAETNAQYLRSELAGTSVVTLQQSISRLLEAEMQKLMLARGNEEFAFRIVDSAVPPQQRARPRRTLAVALAMVVGGMCSVLLVFVRHAVQRAKALRGSSNSASGNA